METSIAGGTIDTGSWATARRRRGSRRRLSQCLPDEVGRWSKGHHPDPEVLRQIVRAVVHRPRALRDRQLALQHVALKLGPGHGGAPPRDDLHPRHLLVLRGQTWIDLIKIGANQPAR